MWRHVLTAVLLFCLGSQETPTEALQTLPTSQPTEEYILYLPLVQSTKVVEAVETARGEEGFYPTEYYLYGYVRNLITEPLYSVIVDLEVTIWPYLYPTSYTEIIHITPALTATLPGQINPFSYSMLLGKADASIGSIRGVSSNPWVGGDKYYPLTIISFTYEDPILSGTARNDSGQSLYKLRVVVVELEKCEWQLAIVDSQNLLPGQETAFHLTYPSGCLGDSLKIVGQGAAQP
jgi:hypothetical protein